MRKDSARLTIVCVSLQCLSQERRNSSLDVSYHTFRYASELADFADCMPLAVNESQDMTLLL
jgi:hypothetical protein